MLYLKKKIFIDILLIRHALLTRYSQGILHESYSSTEVVLFGEILKLIVSAVLVIRENASDATNYSN
jgi:hypothetical protein